MKEENLLELDDKEIQRAVQEFLEREHPDLASRVRHMYIHQGFDDHSWDDPVLRVYLKPSEPGQTT